MSNSTSTSLVLELKASSPLFTYSPNIPDESNNLTGVWQGIALTRGNSTGGGGWGSNNNASQPGGSSGKQTTGDSAIALANIHLTSFTPLFDALSRHTIQLQAPSSSPPQAWASGQTYTQPFGPTSLLLTVQCTSPPCGEPFVFRGAKIGTEIAPPGAAPRGVAIDNASPLIIYTGFAPAGTENHVVQPGEADWAGTLSMTGSGNATAVVRFKGTAILVRGVTAPSLGRFTTQLDRGEPRVSSAQDQVVNHDVPLSFLTSLDAGAVHELKMTTIEGGEGGTGLVIDKVEIWGPDGNVGFIGPDGKLVVPDTPAGTMPGGNNTSGGTGVGTLTGATSDGSPSAGVIVGAVLGTLAALLLLYCFFRKYGQPALKKTEEKKLNPWDEANMLQNQKNEGVYVTTVAKQRYVYPGLIAHSELKK